MKGKDVKQKPQPSEYVVQHHPGAKPGEWQGKFVPATKAASKAAKKAAAKYEELTQGLSKNAKSV
jgi:hypothetical protein